MSKWLGDRFQRIIEWLSQQIGNFIDNVIATVKGIGAWIGAWIAAQWQVMVSWVVSVLPPANPTVDEFITRAYGIWDIFWSYIILAGYFMHFPTFVAVIGIILAGETVLFVVQVYLFIKRLIPVA